MLRLSLTLLFVFGLITAFNNCGTERIDHSYGNNTSIDPDSSTCKRSSIDYNYMPTPCSGFESSFASGSLSNYVDPYNYQLRADVVRMKIDSIPSGVLSGHKKINFYTWHETCDDEKVFSSTPKRFAIQFTRSGSGSFYPKESSAAEGTTNVNDADDSFTDLNAHVINKVSSYFLVSPEEFTDNFFIVFTDLDDSDQAIFMGEYPSAGGSADQKVEFLLPPYWADPSVYRDTHIHNELIYLHPLIKDQNFSNYNDAYSEMMKYCEDMKI